MYHGGYPENVNQFYDIKKLYNFFIIEDACHALGSEYKFKNKYFKVGSCRHADVSTFSLHPLKTITSGEGGIVTTNKNFISKNIKLFRNHGMESRDNVKIFGVNSRLDSLNAEILSYRLTRLEEVVSKRRNNIDLYKKYIKTNKVILPNDSINSFDSYVMMISVCKERDKLQSYLQTKNVQSLIYYGTPLHLHKASESLGYKKGDFVNAERLADNVLSFPHHQYLTEEQIKYVSDCINNFYE